MNIEAKYELDESLVDYECLELMTEKLELLAWEIMDEIGKGGGKAFNLLGDKYYIRIEQLNNKQKEK